MLESGQLRDRVFSVAFQLKPTFDSAEFAEHCKQEHLDIFDNLHGYSNLHDFLAAFRGIERMDNGKFYIQSDYLPLSVLKSRILSAALRRKGTHECEEFHKLFCSAHSADMAPAALFDILGFKAFLSSIHGIRLTNDEEMFYIDTELADFYEESRMTGDECLEAEDVSQLSLEDRVLVVVKSFRRSFSPNDVEIAYRKTYGMSLFAWNKIDYSYLAEILVRLPGVSRRGVSIFEYVARSDAERRDLNSTVMSETAINSLSRKRRFSDVTEIISKKKKIDVVVKKEIPEENTQEQVELRTSNKRSPCVEDDAEALGANVECGFGGSAEVESLKAHCPPIIVNQSLSSSSQCSSSPEPQSLDSVKNEIYGRLLMTLLGDAQKKGRNIDDLAMYVMKSILDLH